ncbi:ketoacyl-ACP synthase III family protein [Streptomyces sioyaensis]|uniref:ketoacyl-ACP synthase III family protein n=1 Tax=Streptomyces sioyaensis TaxID=67364 RepID=UPI0036B97884
MIVEDVYIESLGVVLPEWVSAEKAIADGLWDVEGQQVSGLTGAYTAGDTPAMAMAVTAAQRALERSRFSFDTIGSNIHSSVNYQGPDGTYPPGYILRELGAESISVMNLQQGCNGMLSSLEIAIGQITGAAGIEAVLLTTGENFTSPEINRWVDGGGLVLSDGAMAVVVGGSGGIAQVRSVNTGILPALEKLHRGDGSLLAHGDAGEPPSMIERIERFYESEMPMSEMVERIALFDLSVIHRSLVDAGLNASDIAKVIPVNMNRHMVEFSVMTPLGLPMSRSSWDFGKAVGHVGGADVFITLEHLVRTREVTPGDHLLLVSMGPGWICTAAVVTIVDLPSWAD